jgi:hypothetical protein
MKILPINILALGVKGGVKVDHCGGIKVVQSIGAKLFDLRGRRGSGV